MTRTTLPDDSRALATQAAIARDSALLLEELARRVEQVPAKLAPLIAAESDPAKVRAIIDNEIRRVRREFDLAMLAMVDKFGATEH
jgi:hypothetical protein